MENLGYHFHLTGGCLKASALKPKSEIYTLFQNISEIKEFFLNYQVSVDKHDK